MYTIIKSNIKKFSLLTIFIVAGQLLLIYAATINALVLNELIAMNLERFLKLSIYQMIVWCGIIFLDWVVKNYQVEVIQEFNLEIRNRVATDISNSTYQEFHSKSSGTYLSWLNNDVQTLNDQAFKQLFLVIKGISGTIFAVVTLNHYHWSLTVATLFSLMIMLLVPKIFASKMREVSLNLTNQNEAFLKSSETILNGFDVLASLNLLYVLPKKIKEAGILLKMVIQRKTTVETLAGAISFFLNIFFQISLVFLTGYLAIKGIVKIGTKPIFLKLYSINPIESNKMNDIEPNEVNRDFPLYEAKNICYKYGDKEILKNLNFCFQRNEKYLILGESGSGKSTLLKLLNGFLRDYSGELRFCGDDIKKTSYLNMVSNVLYV
ncbi:TPA: ABC transporter transmembrane domain-containing protein, partial [Streptococcus pneumoniae]